MHEVCLLPSSERVKYLEAINDYHVNVHLDLEKNSIKKPKGLITEVCIQIGDFTKRNRLSLLPHEYVHRQPFDIPKEIIDE